MPSPRHEVRLCLQPLQPLVSNENIMGKTYVNGDVMGIHGNFMYQWDARWGYAKIMAMEAIHLLIKWNCTHKCSSSNISGVM